MALPISYFFDLGDFPHKQLFNSISYPWEVLPLIEKFLKTSPLGHLEGSISPQAYLVNPELIHIGEGTIVEPGAYIQGPCWIGKHCIIRHGAYIRGNVVTGDRCVIGHDTEVKNSLFLNHAHAAHFAYVGDSILGNHVNLGAGTKCANFRLDEGLITVHYQKDRIPTELRKMGAILGDGCQIGCNTVLNPGTIAGQSVNCYPCINVGGFIPSKSTVKSNFELKISSD